MRARLTPRSTPFKTSVFVGIAVFFMICIYYFVPGSFKPALHGESSGQKSVDVVVWVPPAEPVAQSPDRFSRDAYVYPLFAEYYPEEKPAVSEPVKPIVQAAVKPSYRYSLKNHNSAAPLRIAIVIDDVGMNRRQSQAVIAMDKYPITLAFLPYAPHLEVLTVPAKAAGHELLIHMPMEPMNGKIDTGSIALKENMSPTEMRAMMDKAFASFDGYVGINNHMGSRMTQNLDAMALVMDMLDKRGLFYLDSKTISTSVAADAAKVQGLPYAERDVFLDHEETLAYVREALQKVEKVALEKGYAIAIGHPKAVTVEGLREWLPTLAARGFEIVPVSDLLMVPRGKQDIGDVLLAKVEVEKTVSPPVKKTLKIEVEPKKAIQPEAVSELEPAAGDNENDHMVEDLLSAPVGVSNEADAIQSGGLYSLSR